MTDSWNKVDSITWWASGIFGFFLIFPLAFEIYVRYKPNALWRTVIAALVMNILKCILVIKYNEFVYNDNPLQDIFFRIVSASELPVYIFQDIALYTRKTRICPSTTKMDQYVLGFLVFCGVADTFTCFVIGNLYCWVYSCTVKSIHLLILMLYFDVYYCFTVATSSHRNTALYIVLLPVVGTFGNALGYIVGNTAYITGYSNVYTNCIWNVTSVLLPLVALQSSISLNLSYHGADVTTTKTTTKRPQTPTLPVHRTQDTR